jgi:hypothetical protein
MTIFIYFFNFQKEKLRFKTFQSFAKEVLESNFQFSEHNIFFRYRTIFCHQS